MRKRSILVPHRAESGVRSMAARPGLQFSIMPKRWRSAPWQWPLRIPRFSMWVLASSMAAGIAFSAWDYIELIAPILRLRSLGRSIHQRRSAILPITSLMDAELLRFWSIQLIRRRFGYQLGAVLAAVARTAWGPYRPSRHVVSLDRQMRPAQLAP